MRIILIFIALIALFNTSFGQSYRSLQDEISVLEKEYQKTKKLNVLLELNDKYNLNSQYSRGLNSLNSYCSNQSIKISTREKALIDLSYAKNYKYQGRTDLATKHFLLAKKGFAKIHDNTNYLFTGIEIIEFNRKITKYSQAEKDYFYYTWFAKKHQITSPKIWIGLYNRYAAVLNETSRLKTSLVYSRKALSLSKQLNDLNLMAISYNEIGYSYKNMLSIDSCVINYRKASELWMKKGCYRDGIHAKFNLVTFMAHNAYFSRDEEIRQLNEIIQEIDEYKIDYPKSAVYTIVRSHYLFVKDYKKALEIDDSLSKYGTIEQQNIDKLRSEEISEQFKNEELSKENQLKINELKNSEKINFMISSTLLLVILALVGLFILWYKLRIANQQLVKRNEQKSMLVQEIHHRVKNNLQFVRSMLEMQTNSMETAEGVENLDDVTRRIDAMSLVHELLYIEEDGMGISTKKYLEQLIYLTSDMYDAENPIKFKTAIEDVELPVDKIVPIGVICSELFVNSVKHAFKSNEAPIIQLSLEQVSQKTFLLTVSDNGLEAERTSENKRYSLGMRLIDIFSRQLNGTYEINKADGYEFKLQFKI